MNFSTKTLFLFILWDIHKISAGIIKQNTNDASYDDDKLFPVSIIHINDVHARFEETNELSSTCKTDEKCIGGYARAVTIIKKLFKEHSHTNPIYLNAGDSFQGTIWYTFGRWNVTSELFNLLNADAIALGNHDFYDGVAGVIPYMNALNANIVVSNINDTDEVAFQGKYQKSIIIDRFNRKIGVIGVILQDVDKIADTGRLKFFNESHAIKKEAIQLKNQGVDIIIVLSHCGLHIDYVIAQEAGEHIDVIVGGHSHTFMYGNGMTGSPGPDKIQNKYPVVVEHNDGHRVLIVQASAFLKYVGDLTVYFDKNGEVADWYGEPIFLDTDIVKDPDVLNAMKPWKKYIDEMGSEFITKTNVPLLKVLCHSDECLLGDLLTDAFVNYYDTDTIINSSTTNQTKSFIGLISSGTIHSSLNAGDNITYNDLLQILPFENTVDSFELRGDYLMELFEHAVTESWSDETFIGKWLIQVSGARVTYNMSNSINNRIISIEILDHQTSVYRPINLTEYYNCIAQRFLVNGGDGYEMIPKYRRNLHQGPSDIDVVRQYLKKFQNIEIEYEQRLTFSN